MRLGTQAVQPSPECCEPHDPEGYRTRLRSSLGSLCKLPPFCDHVAPPPIRLIGLSCGKIGQRRIIAADSPTLEPKAPARLRVSSDTRPRTHLVSLPKLSGALNAGARIPHHRTCPTRTKPLREPRVFGKKFCSGRNSRATGLREGKMNPLAAILAKNPWSSVNFDYSVELHPCYNFARG